MTDADDRSRAGAPPPAAPDADALDHGAGDAPFEQQLAPIVLEGEQIPVGADEALDEATSTPDEPQPSAFDAVPPPAAAPADPADPAEAAVDAGGVPPTPAAGAAPVLPPPPEAVAGEVGSDMPAPTGSGVGEGPQAVGRTEPSTGASPEQAPPEPPEPVRPESPQAPESARPESPQAPESARSESPEALVPPVPPVPAESAAGTSSSATAPSPVEAVADPATATGSDATTAAAAPPAGADPAATVEAEAGGVPPAPGAGATPVLPPPPDLSEVPADAGNIVAGRVREVRGDDVVVDLDDGRVGVINRRNLGLDGDLAAALSPGDAIEGAVLARSDPQHRVVLSRTWALKKRAWEAVTSAAAENEPLTGTVVSVGQKGVVVDVGVRGFVPASHLELGPVQDLQGYAGQQLTLRVLDLDAERERLVLSRRSLLLKEQRRSAHDALSSIQAGDVRRGTVASLSDYGAFVDLGGVTGLVHLSELSWQRVRHPSEVLSVGDEVEVKVLDVKVKKRRVSLSIRQLGDDPLGALTPGEIRTGPVTRLVDFGAFVDLAGVEGLVHLSELAEYRVSAPEEIVAPGEEVRVKVLSVDRKRRRVELSIRQAAEYGG